MLNSQKNFINAFKELRKLQNNIECQVFMHMKLVFDDELTAELAQAANDRNETLEEKQDMLRECLTKLNDRHRELIRARYQDGFDLADIAEKMNRQTNAIKQALFRARANLIDCVTNKTQESSS